MSDVHPVLIAGEWRAAASTGTFRGENPATGETLPDVFPISSWATATPRSMQRPTRPKLCVKRRPRISPAF